MVVAVFSIGITVDGEPLTYFSNVVLQRSFDGLGFSGMAVAQLSFETTKDAWLSIDPQIMAEVTITGLADNSYIPSVFYIDNRSLNDTTVSVKALDSLALASNSYLTASQIESIVNISTATSHHQFLQRYLASSIGLSNTTETTQIDSYLADDVRYTADKLENTSTATLLQDIAELCGGVWIVQGRLLYLITTDSTLGNVETTQYTTISEGLTYELTGVSLTDADGNEYTTGDTTYSYSTLTVESDVATEKQLSCMKHVIGSYAVADVDKVYIDMDSTGTIPLAPYKYALNDTTITARSTTINIEPYGLLCSISTNNPLSSETGIKGKLTRQIDNSVSLNDGMGCCMVTAYQGVIWIDS